MSSVFCRNKFCISSSQFRKYSRSLFSSFRYQISLIEDWYSRLWSLHLSNSGNGIFVEKWPKKKSVLERRREFVSACFAFADLARVFDKHQRRWIFILRSIFSSFPSFVWFGRCLVDRSTWDAPLQRRSSSFSRVSNRWFARHHVVCVVNKLVLQF